MPPKYNAADHRRMFWARVHDPAQRNLVDNTGTGPVTDYSATMLNWMHNFQPSWAGGYDGERERPHPAWITKVGLSSILVVA